MASGRPRAAPPSRRWRSTRRSGSLFSSRVTIDSFDIVRPAPEAGALGARRDLRWSSGTASSMRSWKRRLTTIWRSRTAQKHRPDGICMLKGSSEFQSSLLPVLQAPLAACSLRSRGCVLSLRAGRTQFTHNRQRARGVSQCRVRAMAKKANTQKRHCASSAEMLPRPIELRPRRPSRSTRRRSTTPTLKDTALRETLVRLQEALEERSRRRTAHCRGGAAPRGGAERHGGREEDARRRAEEARLAAGGAPRIRRGKEEEDEGPEPEQTADCCVRANNAASEEEGEEDADAAAHWRQRTAPRPRRPEMLRPVRAGPPRAHAAERARREVSASPPMPVVAVTGERASPSPRRKKPRRRHRAGVPARRSSRKTRRRPARGRGGGRDRGGDAAPGAPGLRSRRSRAPRRCARPEGLPRARAVAAPWGVAEGGDRPLLDCGDLITSARPRPSRSRCITPSATATSRSTRRVPAGVCSMVWRRAVTSSHAGDIRRRPAARRAWRSSRRRKRSIRSRPRPRPAGPRRRKVSVPRRGSIRALSAFLRLMQDLRRPGAGLRTSSRRSLVRAAVDGLLRSR